MQAENYASETAGGSVLLLNDGLPATAGTDYSQSEETANRKQRSRVRVALKPEPVFIILLLSLFLGIIVPLWEMLKKKAQTIF